MEKKTKSKKRARAQDEEDMDIENEENVIDIENQIDDEIENVEFNFSNILEADYQSLKPLLQQNFQFENINIGELADLLISQHEDVGTTIRADEQIFGVFSYIPLSSNLAKTKHSSFIDEFYKFIKLKTKNADEINKKKILEIIDDKKLNLGLIISERILNLPEETIPPALGLATKEINECREVEEKDYDKRFDFDYLILISKFVKIIGENRKDNKKFKKEEKLENNEAYYKFEAPLFFKKAVAGIEYKIPYKEKNMDILENSNQPQYIKILFIKANEYYDTIQQKLGCKFE